jgi:hypothetical protein
MSVAAMAAAMGMSINALFGNGGSRIVAKRTREHGWSTPHQGAQEMARRRRQIDRGILTYSNGVAR